MHCMQTNMLSLLSVNTSHCFPHTENFLTLHIFLSQHQQDWFPLHTHHSHTLSTDPPCFPHTTTTHPSQIPPSFSYSLSPPIHCSLRSSLSSTYSPPAHTHFRGHCPLSKTFLSSTYNHHTLHSETHLFCFILTTPNTPLRLCIRSSTHPFFHIPSPTHPFLYIPSPSKAHCFFYIFTISLTLLPLHTILTPSSETHPFLYTLTIPTHHSLTKFSLPTPLSSLPFSLHLRFSSMSMVPIPLLPHNIVLYHGLRLAAPFRGRPHSC